jgi:hypothetical protein
LYKARSRVEARRRVEMPMRQRIARMNWWITSS